MGLGLLFAATASATTITYNFTVTATSGPLGGTVSHGTFAYDSSSIMPGHSNVAADLLTYLDFTWNGIAYDATSANTGWLTFDGSGQLTYFTFGNACVGGSCGVTAGNDQWYIFPIGFDYSVLGGNSYWLGDVTYSQATGVPEPAALGMFGFGVLLIGAFAGLRRRVV
jgi:hypothetical protein